MKYDVDYDFPYERTKEGTPIVPAGTYEQDGLYVLPNGRYMPPGAYYYPESGCDIIYEPIRLDLSSLDRLGF